MEIKTEIKDDNENFIENDNDNNNKNITKNKKYNDLNYDYNNRQKEKERENEIFITKDEQDMLNSEFNRIFRNFNEKNPLIMSVQEELLNSRVNQLSYIKNIENNSKSIKLNENYKYKNKDFNDINNLDYNINKPETKTYTEKIIKTTIQYEDDNNKENNNNEKKSIIKKEKIIVNNINNDDFNNNEIKNNYKYNIKKSNNIDEDNNINKNVENEQIAEETNNLKIRDKYQIKSSISKEIKETKKEINNFDNINKGKKYENNS